MVTIAGASGLSRLDNAAAARSYGVDVDITGVLSNQLQVTLAGEWLHSRYRSYPEAQVFVQQAYGFRSERADVSGNTTTRSPGFSGSAQVDYSVPISAGSLKFNAAYRYSEGYFFDAANEVRQDSFHLVNLRAGIEFNGGYSLTAFVDNLFNETILVGVPRTALVTLGQYGAPRIFGVTAAAKF